MRRLVCLVLVLACTLPPAAAGPRPPSDWIPGEVLRADVALLRRAFETLHPGLLRYQTPDEARARFEALDAAVAGGMTRADAFLALARFTAAIRCGHTYPNFHNQSAEVTRDLVTAGRRLPLYFRWIDGWMVVTRSLAGRLAPGTEVLALDGVRADSVLARLLPLARADGGLDAKRIATLEVRGDARYEAFDVYYPLVVGLGESVALRVREPGEAVRTVSVPTMTDAEREAVRAARPGRTRLGWSVRALDDSTALVTMPSWATYHETWDWRAVVDSTFDALVARGTLRLILDLRGNEGGTDVGHAILARLADRDLPLASFERWVRARSLPPDLRPFLDTWDRSFDDWRAHTPYERDGLWRLTRWDDADDGSVVRPSGRRYGGRVAVLVGPSNSSATFVFASAVRRHGLGLLVGQPTGGNERGLNGGAFYFLRLPGSGIEVDLPLVGAFPPGGAASAPDAGLAPDVPVAPRIEDVARGIDTELEAARAALAPPPADPLAPFRVLVGRWAGELTYLDYADDATRVTLGMRTTVREDAGALILSTVYTEPDGREVGGGDVRFVPGSDPSRLTYGAAEWRVVSREAAPGRLALVVERDGDDNDRPGTIRLTLTVGPGAWQVVKDVRYSGMETFFERNRSVLRAAE